MGIRPELSDLSFQYTMYKNLCFILLGMCMVSFAKARDITENRKPLEDDLVDERGLDDERNLDCPAFGTDCPFMDIERAADASSWQQCAYQCANHKTCVYWSWRIPSANDRPYGCWLKSSCPIPVQDMRSIAGHYTCRG